MEQHSHLEQESPPAWTQEAYRPQEGARCWTPPWLDLTPPGWTWPPPGLDLTPPASAGPDPPLLDLTPPLGWLTVTLTPPPPPHRLTDLIPPPTGWTWPPPVSWLTWPPPAGLTWPPPLDSDLTPPQVWTDWKHYLPHPSDAGGNKLSIVGTFLPRKVVQFSLLLHTKSHGQACALLSSVLGHLWFIQKYPNLVFPLFGLLNLSNFLKYWSSLLTNTCMSYVPVSM